MNTEVDPTRALPLEGQLTEAEKLAMAQFQNALDACVVEWASGNSLVVFPGNLQELFGDVALQYFERTLIEFVGNPVTFTFFDDLDGHHTLIQMPEVQKAQVLSQLLSHEPTPQADKSKRAMTYAGVRKAPRPMNCWIIFRDAMHKKIKAENPNLRVQEISTRCSEIWHRLSPAEKEPWKAAAKSAKEEHFRLHPDYKYTPRKPGQKKKRCSRKTKLATSTATTTDLFQSPSFADQTLTAPAENAASTIPTSNDIANSVNDAAQFPMSNGFLDMSQETSMLSGLFHDAEAIRQQRLEAEFASSFDIDLAGELFGEDEFAFRDGADNNATLPVIDLDLF